MAIKALEAKKKGDVRYQQLTMFLMVITRMQLHVIEAKIVEMSNYNIEEEKKDE
ncbi:MAG: hypothetical protein KAS32_23780 [Candidatus Peribacteraceae bacterium]|nr:hypothetical protein [Candidatus Peribacteraceae bacterium]